MPQIMKPHIRDTRLFRRLFEEARPSLYDFPLLLSVPRIGVVLVILVDFLFNSSTITKLHIVSILLFWTDDQEGVEFF